MPRELALTRSSWINAWTLRRACRELGVELRTTAAVRELPLPPARPGLRADWLFFTDEASLAGALANALAGPATGSPRFLPQQFPAALLDDKQAFADWLAQDAAGPPGLAHWPLQRASLAAYPLLLKSRHSWVDGRKLPRGWVCRDAGELALARSRLAGEGLNENWFFLQQWLGDAPMQLLSVAGFFDAADESRNLVGVTDRLADYGAGPSSSAMLVTVDDRHGLVELAARVLRRLSYCGPYEIEFIVTADGRCRVLELNPRFWMQHGLFLAAGNGLVRRYLGRDTTADRAAALPPGLLWIDGPWLLRRLVRFDRALLVRLWQRIVRCGDRAVVCPSLPALAGAALWRLFGGRR